MEGRTFDNKTPPLLLGSGVIAAACCWGCWPKFGAMEPPEEESLLERMRAGRIRARCLSSDVRMFVRVFLRCSRVSGGVTVAEEVLADPWLAPRTLSRFPEEPLPKPSTEAVFASKGCRNGAIDAGV